MNFVELILQNRLDEAKELIFERLNDIASVRMEEAKPYVVDAMFEEIEVDEEVLEEAQNISEIVTNEMVRDSLSKNGKAQAEKFSWQKTAQKLLEIFIEMNH